MPKDKSVGAALVLTFLFGPLGLLYVSVVGGLVMMLIAVVVAVLTLGLGLLLVWPITMIWGAIAASNHHSRYQAWLAHQYGHGTAMPPPPTPPTIPPTAPPSPSPGS